MHGLLAHGDDDFKNAGSDEIFYDKNIGQRITL